MTAQDDLRALQQQVASLTDAIRGIGQARAQQGQGQGQQPAKKKSKSMDRMMPMMMSLMAQKMGGLPPEQQKAARAVMASMQSGKPMGKNVMRDMMASMMGTLVDPMGAMLMQQMLDSQDEDESDGNNDDKEPPTQVNHVDNGVLEQARASADQAAARSATAVLEAGQCRAELTELKAASLEVMATVQALARAIGDVQQQVSDIVIEVAAVQTAVGIDETDKQETNNPSNQPA